MSDEKKKGTPAPLPDRLEVILAALTQHGIPWIEEAITAARLNDELNSIIGDMRGQIAEMEAVEQSSKRTLAEVVMDNTKLRNQIAAGVSGDIRTALKERDQSVAAMRELTQKLDKLEGEQVRKNMKLVELQTKVKLLEAEVIVQRKRGAKVLDMLSKQNGLISTG